MTEIRRYTKKPITIEAVQLQGYGDFTRAVVWINDNGGSAVFSPKLKEGEDHLIIQTIEGNMEAHTGWFVIKGIKGEFYPCEPEIFKLSYDAEPVEEITARRPGDLGRSTSTDGAPRLDGGMALPVPA